MNKTKDFLDIDFSNQYKTEEMGSVNSFQKILYNLEESLVKYLKECIIISDNNKGKIPKEILNQIVSFVDTLESIYVSLMNYQYQTDLKNNLYERDQIIKRITTVIKEAYYSTRDSLTILNIYSFLKTFDIKNSAIDLTEFNNKTKSFEDNLSQKEKDINEKIEDSKKEYESLQTKAKTVLEDLEKAASKVSIDKFAGIFKDQALQHSKNSFRLWNNKEERLKNPKLGFLNLNRWGASERWLVISLSFIICLIAFLAYSYQFIPVVNNNMQVDIKNIVFKVSIVTILFFLIKFSIKQYSVNKHLYTVNKHRENTLSSYRLFVDSMSTEDAELRNTLMLTVAKAIYENSKTGYISDKDGDVATPSMIELTRLVGNKNS